MAILRRSLPRFLERKRERYSRRGDWQKLEQLGSVVPFDIFSRIAGSKGRFGQCYRQFLLA